MKLCNTRRIVSAACGLILVLNVSAQNLVTNGGFEITINGSDRQLGFNTNAVGFMR